MNEKMTDGELEKARGIADALNDEKTSTVHRLLAHIAAVTAERDAMEQERDEASALVTENAQLRERVESLDASRSEFFNRAQSAKAELADECKAHMRTQEEVRALRERVDGLESQHGADAHHILALESDIDVLRGRAQALEAQCDERRRAFVSENVRAQNAEDRLAAIRQRAGDERRMAEHALPSEKARLVTRAIDRILGVEARPSAPPEAFTHEKGLDAGVFDVADSPADMTDEEARRICAEVGVDVEAGVKKCLEMVAARRAQSEPTTSEAFAAVREGLELLPDGTGVPYIDHILASLSLLKRRMGAQEAAILLMLRLHEQGLAGSHDNAGWDVLRAALTDAPPVFTLEEIQRAMSGAAILERDRLAVEVLLEKLTAIRRTS